MDDHTLYSFEATTTEMMQTLMKEAVEECDRITRLRQCEMSSYEDDDMYDEIKNWMAQASEELTRRGTVAYTKPEVKYLGGFPQRISTNTDKDSSDNLEDFTLPPAPTPTTPPVVKKTSLPTLDEYYSMTDSDQSRWRCLHCCRPALEGSAIPGSFCSSACALHKYG